MQNRPLPLRNFQLLLLPLLFSGFPTPEALEEVSVAALWSLSHRASQSGSSCAKTNTFWLLLALILPPFPKHKNIGISWKVVWAQGLIAIPHSWTSLLWGLCSFISWSICLEADVAASFNCTWDKGPWQVPWSGGGLLPLTSSILSLTSLVNWSKLTMHAQRTTLGCFFSFAVW